MKVKVLIRNKSKEFFVSNFELGNQNIELSSEKEEAQEFGEITALYLQKELLNNRDVRDVDIC